MFQSHNPKTSVLCVSIAVILLLLSLFLNLPTAFAQGSWPLVGTMEPGAQSFEFRHEREGIYHIRITADPILKFVPERRALDLDFSGHRLKKTELERVDAGGLALSWEIDLSEIETPDMAIANVRAIFDNDIVEIRGTNIANYRFNIPEGATSLESVEIDFKWLEYTDTLSFEASASGAGSIGFTTLDPEVSLSEALPLQIVRITASLQTDPDSARMPELPAIVTNRRTSETVEIKLKQTKRKSRTFTSNPLLLAVENADSNNFPEISTCPGDVLEVSFAGQRGSLSVLEPDEDLDLPPCSVLPPFPVLKFEARGSVERTIDPARQERADSLKVRLLDERNNPISGEEIIWRFPALDGRAVSTFTDRRGFTRLDFAIQVGGSFAVVVDGLVTDLALSDGSWDIEVTPKDPLIASLSQQGVVNFKVDLVVPTAISLFDRRGAPVSVLLDDTEFFIRLRLGRADMASTGQAGEIALKVLGKNGDEVLDSIDVKAEKTAVRNTFETPIRTFAVVRGESLRTGEIIVPDRGIVSVVFNSTEYKVPFYKSSWSKLDVETKVVLDFWKDALEGSLSARGLLPEEREILEYRLSLLENARAWLEEPHPDDNHRFAVAKVYLNLISADIEDLGEPVDRPATNEAIPSSLRGTTIRFVSSEEARLVTSALVEASGLSAESIRAIPSSTAQNVTDFVKSLPESVLSPAIGAYVAATGYTADGQVATVLERVLGGVDGALAVVGTTGALAKFASFTRAARAMGLRVALSEINLAGLTFREILDNRSGASLPVYVARDVAFEAVQRGKPARGPRKIERLTKSSKRSGYYIDKFSSEAADARKQIETLEQKLRSHEQRLAAAQAAGRGTKGVTNDIGIAEKKITAATRRAKELEKKVTNYRVRKEKADLALGRIAKRKLTEAELEGLKQRGELPRARDRIGEKMAQEHYEEQVNDFLAEEGYQAGTGVRLRTAYPSPLGEGHGAAASRGSREATKAPVMDHVNPTTLDVADSKYYNLKGAGEGTEKALKAAREIADTAEKGRLVQIQKVRKQRADRGLPLDNESVWEDVCQRKVTIITPTDMPGHIQDLIKLFVGEKSARNVKFRTVAAMVDGWER